MSIMCLFIQEGSGRTLHPTKPSGKESESIHPKMYISSIESTLCKVDVSTTSLRNLLSQLSSTNLLGPKMPLFNHIYYTLFVLPYFILCTRTMFFPHSEPQILIGMINYCFILLIPIIDMIRNMSLGLYQYIMIS